MKPRAELRKYAPRILTLKINPEKIGALIGPGGKNIKRIVDESGCEIIIEDDAEGCVGCRRCSRRSNWSNASLATAGFPLPACSP
jgi:polyribonucleotide nucleotidyltransferase